MTMISKRFSIEQCRVNPLTLFIFGDNYNLRVGMAGQAVIREQKNAIGLSSKKNPGMKEEDFFTDVEYIENCKIIDEDIKRIKHYFVSGGFENYCFPYMGIGTGLALLPVKAPLTYCYLTEQLIHHFEFNNLAGAFESKNK